MKRSQEQPPFVKKLKRHQTRHRPKVGERIYAKSLCMTHAISVDPRLHNWRPIVDHHQCFTVSWRRHTYFGLYLGINDKWAVRRDDFYSEDEMQPQFEEMKNIVYRAMRWKGDSSLWMEMKPFIYSPEDDFADHLHL